MTPVTALLDLRLLRGPPASPDLVLHSMSCNDSVTVDKITALCNFPVLPAEAKFRPCPANMQSYKTFFLSSQHFSTFACLRYSCPLTFSVALWSVSYRCSREFVSVFGRHPFFSLALPLVPKASIRDTLANQNHNQITQMEFGSSSLDADFSFKKISVNANY